MSAKILAASMTKRGFLRGMATLASIALAPRAIAQEQYGTVFPMGNTGVFIWVYLYGSGHTYFAPHADETTSIAAAHAALAEHGGTLVELVHRGTRNITFVLNETTHLVDPNRIFTDAGIATTLSQQGSTYSEAAHELVGALARNILDRLENIRPRRGTLVTLHNNTNDNYSIESYREGGVYARDASRVHINPDIDRDDFYFTTVPEVYEFLEAQNRNVALQSSAVTDDGSLSVYCARENIPYINVEAQRGHLDVQIEMINLIADL